MGDIDALVARLRKRGDLRKDLLVWEAADALEAMRAEVAAEQMERADAELCITALERRLISEKERFAAERARAERLAAGGDQLAEAIDQLVRIARDSRISEAEALHRINRVALDALSSWRALRDDS